MRVPKTLLIVNGSPQAEHVGEIFLRTLCGGVPQDGLCRFSLVEGATDGASGRWMGFPSSVGRCVREVRFRRLGTRGSRIACSMVNAYARLINAPRLVSEAVRLGREQGVEQVWAVLNMPQVIYMARRVAQSLGVPLLVSVWDPPERFALHLNMDPWSRKCLLRDFSRALVSARRCAVASWEMRSKYADRFGIESIVLIQGIDRDWQHAPATGLSRSSHFTLGFAGNMYATAEWHALISALCSVGWRIQGREVTIRFLGESIGVRTNGKARVEYLGWRPLRETIDLLSEADVGYVPYWLDERYRDGAQLCFPNKVSAYMASGRPMFVHAPRDSTPARFAGRFGVGLCCHSSEPEEILDTLSRFVTEPELYLRMARATQDALDKELDLEIFLTRFAKFIGSGEGDLCGKAAGDTR